MKMPRRIGPLAGFEGYPAVPGKRRRTTNEINLYVLLPEELEDVFGIGIGDLQRLDAQLLLGLECFQAS